ncbi:MAG: hypothetical protein V3V14_10725 [Saprospiraceae bacterium]
MKYFLFVFSFLLIVSCDNELDLVAPNKEIPVVYGIIDQSDSIQYIRVERVFLDPNVAAPIIAKNPDSLYFEGITVKLIRESTGEEYEMERIDGNLEGLVRDDGAFADTPNYLYKILTENIPLLPKEKITISIEGIYEDRNVTATTAVIEPPIFITPVSGSNFSLSPFDSKITIGWNPKANAVIFTPIFSMDIEETKDGEITNKHLKWVVESNLTKSKISALRGDFFRFLIGALKVDPEITRRLSNFEFALVSGDANVSAFINVGQANLGLTSSGEIPNYSNLSEGLGIFGATYTDRRVELRLNGTSRDSLKNSTITRDLNFK